MALLSAVLLGLLHPGQAEAVLRHVFAALRMFVQRLGSALYHGGWRLWDTYDRLMALVPSGWVS